MTNPGGEVFRQHYSTDVTEVEGHVCEEFLEVRGLESRKAHYFYLKLSGLYHRFSLDVGLLRWRSHQQPDPEHDLDLDCCYVDLGSELKVLGVALERAHMEDDQFDLTFANGVKLRIRYFLTEDDEWMTVESPE